MKGFFCKSYWRFLFDLVVASRLLTQSAALCCFSENQSHFPSPCYQERYPNQLGPSQKHTRKKRQTFLVKSAKVHFLLLSMQSGDVLVAH